MPFAWRFNVRRLPRSPVHFVCHGVEVKREIVSAAGWLFISSGVNRMSVTCVGAASLRCFWKRLKVTWSAPAPAQRWAKSFICTCSLPLQISAGSWWLGASCQVRQDQFHVGSALSSACCWPFSSWHLSLVLHAFICFLSYAASAECLPLLSYVTCMQCRQQVLILSINRLCNLTKERCATNRCFPALLAKSDAGAFSQLAATSM